MTAHRVNKDLGGSTENDSPNSEQRDSTREHREYHPKDRDSTHLREWKATHTGAHLG